MVRLRCQARKKRKRKEEKHGTNHKKRDTEQEKKKAERSGVGSSGEEPSRAGDVPQRDVT